MKKPCAFENQERTQDMLPETFGHIGEDPEANDDDSTYAKSLRWREQATSRAAHGSRMRL